MKTTTYRKFVSSSFALSITFLCIALNMFSRKDRQENNSTSKVSLTHFSSGRQPASLSNTKGLNVVIPYGEIAYLDESTNIDTLTINGELRCDEVNADPIVELRVKTIYINGKFICGTNSNPYNKKLIISLKSSDLDPKTDHGYRGIVVMNGGQLSLYGDRKNSGWRKLGQTAMPGDESIVLRSNNLEPLPIELVKKVNLRTPSSILPISYGGNPWSVGDEITLAPTGYNYAEAEKFIITDIDPNDPDRVYLDHPVQYMHWGEKQTFQSSAFGSIVLDESAEVANLTRSIVIRADEEDFTIDESDAPTAQRGGHVMAHHGSFSYIDAVEFYKMGQAGVMARYPFHWHYVGDAPGQFVRNSSIHHSFQRCITIHRTHKVTLQNNVCYDFKGHGYFLEDGNEIQNKLIKNLAIMAKAPSASKLLLASDDVLHSEGQGRFPSVSGFWISNPNNYIINNVAAGSVGTGIWMSFENEVKDQSGNVVARPLTTNTDVFNYNTAHSNKVGITWDGAPGWENANNPNNPNDKKLASAHYAPPTTPTFIGLKAYKNYLSGIYFRGQTAVYKNAVVADNGWSFWVAYNQIVKDSIFIGETENQSDDYKAYYFLKTRTDRYRKTGIVLYDGPFEVHNSDFLDFSTSPSTYTKTNNQTVNNTVVPFTSTGGSNKFTNVVSQLRFSPEPVYRTHLESSTENFYAQSSLGNAVIRDLDGSLSGTNVNSVIVGARSLGVMPESQCVDGGTKYLNFKICPSNYSEGSQTFMRWESAQASPWGTPFVVLRSDGETNYPISVWNSITALPNNLFATINSQSYSYELLPKYQYAYDRSIGVRARMDANTEKTSPVIPLIKVVAYGKNCRLEDGAVKSNSLAELYNQNVTSYYTNGENFYVRIIPVERWVMISEDPIVQATSNATNKRYGIHCDEEYLVKKIKGNIEKVERTATTTTISGWACNWTHNASVQVKVYARQKNLLPRKTVQTLITTGNSNLTPDPRVSVNCGTLSGSGRRFSITMQNSTLSSFTNHTFYVQGISNSGGADLYISNSGKYSVLPVNINTTKAIKALIKK